MYTDSLVADWGARLGIAHLTLHLKADWNSGAADHRQQIRKHIFTAGFMNESVLNLEQTPKKDLGALSISHNKKCGGYIVSNEDVFLGFDIELNHRLDAKKILQAAAAEEAAEAPTPCSLWTAKEAAFKCLPAGLQPTVIKEIKIGGWKQLGENLYSCRIESVRNQSLESFRGIVFIDTEQTVAIFKGDPCALAAH